MSDGNLFKAIKNTISSAKTVVSAASELIIPKRTEESQQSQSNSNEGNFESGLYFRPHKSEFTGLIPIIDFFEPQKMGLSLATMFKNLSFSQAQNIFYRGCRALVGGVKDKAREYFKKTLEKDPRLADAYFMLGIFDWQERKFKKASENFRKAMLMHGYLGSTIKPALPSFRLIMPITANLSYALYPDLVGISIMLALCLRASESNESIKDLEQMLDLLPGQNSLLFIMSLLLYEQGKREKIIEILKPSTSDAPKSALNLLILAKSLSELGQSDSSLQIAGSMLDSDNLDPDLRQDFIEIERVSRQQEQGKTTSPIRLLLFERLQIKEPQTDSGNKIKKVIRKPENDADFKEIFYLINLATGKKYKLRTKTTIGTTGCDLNFTNDPDLKACHALIASENGKWHIEPRDEGSAIYINNFKINKKAPINIGDTIQIASSEFEFKYMRKQ